MYMHAVKKLGCVPLCGGGFDKSAIGLSVTFSSALK